ncbi:hypothetical protein ABL841_13085 [Variovorax paradoxus]|uniref:hypothetical protein n=1 Tax=Variovorax paradoxus TaxID=34073 RepID=UPI00035D6173
MDDRSMMKTPLLAGRRLALICETSTESYSFGPDGTVAAILGEKNGPACAPIFRYRVLSADSIELLDGDGVFAAWTHIEIDGDLLRARCNGQAKVFRIG